MIFATGFVIWLVGHFLFQLECYDWNTRLTQAVATICIACTVIGPLLMIYSVLSLAARFLP